ncbi:MAG TPA: hypothetical protein VGG74_36925 [Kofleriaceae bacterium]
MFPTVERTADDAEGFVEAVDRVLAGVCFRFQPELACVIRIRRWFDHRWLRFSGNGRVRFPFFSGLRGSPDVSLDPFRQDRLTFPPFTPNRVASEIHWGRWLDGNYALVPRHVRVHRPWREHSAHNLHRRVADFTSSGLFVWFSSTSAADCRASLLVYIVSDGVTIPWFASLLERDGAWQVGEIDGLGRLELQELLDWPPGVHST